MIGLRYAEEDRGFETPCWIWGGWTSDSGYGMSYGLDGCAQKARPAHVLMWERENGASSKGLHVHHSCEVRNCVRPEHLRALTVREHMALHGRRPKPTLRKLDDAQAAQIRARWADGDSGKLLSREFGVSYSTIRQIIDGRSYKTAQKEVMNK